MSGFHNAYPQMTRLAWRNARRNWRHSLATIVAIAAGFTAVSLFDGFLGELHERNVEHFTTRIMLGDVIVQKIGAGTAGSENQWVYSLGREEQAFLEDYLPRDPAFVRRVRFLRIIGMASSGASSTVFSSFAYDTKEGGEVRGESWYWNALAGVPLEEAKTPSVLVGATLGRLIACESTYRGPNFFLANGNYIPEYRPFHCAHPRVTLSATTEAAQVNAIDLPVSGIFDGGFREMDKRAVRIDLRDAQRLLDTDKISMVSIQLARSADREAFMARLRAAAVARGLELEVSPWERHPMATSVSQALQLLSVFRNFFMTIVVMIGVMSIANTMMKSVSERIREIGALRSLGFYRRDLVYMFSVEGMFLSLIACALGLLTTLLLIFLIDRSGLSYRAGLLAQPVALKVGYAFTAWVDSAVFLALLATGTAWFCARRAVRMVVADAMRHV